jgi:tetratricopeptide (TPR) repeat protein
MKRSIFTILSLIITFFLLSPFDANSLSPSLPDFNIRAPKNAIQNAAIGTADFREHSASQAKEEAKAKLERAKKIYFNYYKDLTNLDRSIKILQEILKKDPKNLEALVFLSRVWLTYGYRKAPNDKEKIRAFKNGLEVAKKAIKLAPNNPDAHAFYVANLGSWGATQGVSKSLFMLPEIKRELKLILKLDPDHVYGLGLSGVLYYTIPGFLGGDLHMSEIYLRKAIRLDPHLPVLKNYLAENLIKQKKYNEAKKMLREVIEEKNPTVYADWYFNKETSKRMIARIEEESRRTPPPTNPMFQNR